MDKRGADYWKEYYVNNREAISKRKKKYWAENKERLNQQSREYYAANQEKLNKRAKEYYFLNKEAILKRHREYYEKNKGKICVRQKKLYERRVEEMIEYRKKHYSENKEKILARNRKYDRNNRERLAKARKKKRRENISFHLACNFRSRISNILGRARLKKLSDTFDLVGCDIEELKAHLESQFTKGMSWDTYGKDGWHVDHIKPCASFDLSKLSEQKKCFHYTNLQPLWWEDNLSKGSKYEGERCFY